MCDLGSLPRRKVPTYLLWVLLSQLLCGLDFESARIHRVSVVSLLNLLLSGELDVACMRHDDVVSKRINRRVIVRLVLSHQYLRNRHRQRAQHSRACRDLVPCPREEQLGLERESRTNQLSSKVPSSHRSKSRTFPTACDMTAVLCLASCSQRACEVGW